jgi:hypothetical protein
MTGLGDPIPVRALPARARARDARVLGGCVAEGRGKLFLLLLMPFFLSPRRTATTHRDVGSALEREGHGDGCFGFCLKEKSEEFVRV